MEDKSINIGIVGTGFIAKGLAEFVTSSEDMNLVGIVTRRNIDANCIPDIDLNILTNEVRSLQGKCDVVIVSTGDPIYNTTVIESLFEAGIPVITMDAETQVTSGSFLAKRGKLIEAEGDQPGCLAALKMEVESMGFEPIVYGNIKGFLNHKPKPEEMIFWSKKQGISLENVISFTDGTKVQIEQALVANGLGANIAQQGLIGPQSVNLSEGIKLLESNLPSLNVPISDYVVSTQGPPGVFILAKHSLNQSEYLRYYKMGQGPNYTFTKAYHLCHLEILKTVRQVIAGGNYFFNNGENPQISVGAIAKRNLSSGEVISRGIGSFDFRGEALSIKDNQAHVPIGLMYNVVIKRDLEEGELITFDDVDIPESSALLAWQETLKILQEQ